MSLYNSSGSLRASFAYDDSYAKMHILNRSNTPIFTVEEPNGNVGIGTTSPSALLELSSTISQKGRIRITETATVINAY